MTAKRRRVPVLERVRIFTSVQRSFPVSGEQSPMKPISVLLNSITRAERGVVGGTVRPTGSLSRLPGSEKDHMILCEWVP